MTFVLGLTGSIGMGKSTTTAMFRDLGVSVWDADAAVHRLYEPGGAAVAPVSALVPEAFVDGGIDRNALKRALSDAPTLFSRLEGIVHPLVAEDRQRFIDEHSDDQLIVLDIPLLFEVGSEASVDAVAVVSTDPATQRTRVMARPGMTEAQYDQILSRQMPDAEKRRRADFIIPTDSLDETRQHVADLVSRLRRPTNA